MRKNPTLSELRLWEWLRRRQAGGFKFRRQHVIAGYIVDFYCPELRLVIEVDGPIHADHVLEDDARSSPLPLARQGPALQALQVMDNTLAVVQRIATECCHRAAQLGVPLDDGSRRS